MKIRALPPTLLLFWCCPATAENHEHPRVIVDRSVYLDDLVVLGKAAPDESGGNVITVPIYSAPVDLTEFTEGLVNGDASNIKSSGAGSEADRAFNNLSRFVRR